MDANCKRGGIVKKMISFLRNFWYIPVFVVIAIVLFLAQRRRLALRLLKTEIEASRAAQKAARNTIELGADLARKTVLMDYSAKLTNLRGEHRKRVAELMNDPEKLSRYLVKLDTDL